MEEMKARLARLRDRKGHPVLYDDCTTFESLKKRVLDFDKTLDLN